MHCHPFGYFSLVTYERLLEFLRCWPSYVGTHATLLARPGTGKTLTLTRRAVYLAKEKEVSPPDILALTFTRAAAYELRNRINSTLGNSAVVPTVSTLHSFALWQLLRNSGIVDSLPQPLRIADDWEERNIIREDLKAISGVPLDDIRNKFSLLSADWQTLTADEEDWETQLDEHWDVCYQRA